MEVSIEELIPMLGKINLIDIRSNQSYNNNHIEGAINVPYEKLIVTPKSYLNYNERYYIYCRCGMTSKKICTILSNLGYQVVNIKGGYEEWILKK